MRPSNCDAGELIASAHEGRDRNSGSAVGSQPAICTVAPAESVVSGGDPAASIPVGKGGVDAAAVGYARKRACVGVGVHACMLACVGECMGECTWRGGSAES